MNNNDSTPYVINNEHYLRILMEYMPRQLDSIVRLSSKSFNRVIIDINNTNKCKIITGHQLIEYLIINGMVTLFDFAKESGCNFNSRFLCNIAARNGQIDCLNHLRFKGYSVDGKSAMISAASGGHLQMMIYLHEEIKCEWPDDICYHSASGGNVDCLDYSHQHGCKSGKTLAKVVGRSIFGKLLGIDSSSSGIASCINAKSKSGELPFNVASREGHLHMVRELLDRGANINAVDDYDRNSLMLASHSGHTDAVRELLNRGAKVNALDEYGWNSLSLASQGGHVEVVRELLDRGADIDARSSYGKTAASIARGQGHKGVADLIEKHSSK